MRVILHVGMHKTGTSSLQRCLASNAEALAEQGVRPLVNPLQAVVYRPDLYDPDWLCNQLRDAYRSGVRRFVISAEVLSVMSAADLAALVRTVSPHPVEIVLCLRHWSGFLPSRWSQNCLRRDTQSLPEYIAGLRRVQDSHIEARIDLLVGRLLAAGAERLKIVSYDNADAYGRLMPVLTAALGLKPWAKESAPDTPLRVNRRAPLALAETCRLFNGVKAEAEGLPPNEFFDAIHEARPIATVFDLAAKVRTKLAANPGLNAAIAGFFSAHMRTIDVDAEIPELPKWREAAERAAAPYLVNPRHGALFGHVVSKKTQASGATAAAIDPGLKRRMRDALHAP